MNRQFYSNGKLLLTAEYLVLKGAEAIAFPLKRGQSLHVEKNDLPGQLQWNTYYNDENIFHGLFSLEKKQFISTSDKKTSSFLSSILKNLTEEISHIINGSGLTINTYLEFPFEWGLGSSSSLINNLAAWLQVDPFELNNRISEGSGYDIACASSNRPIIYKKNGGYPVYNEVEFNPSYKDSLFFIYTGKKQNTRKEVKKYLTFNQGKAQSNFFRELHSINHEILNSNNLITFENAITEHEKLISNMLQQPTIQEQIFPDFPGKIKSLGAWGGDFILVTWKNSRKKLSEYFNRHNMNILFSWDELIKNKQNA